MKTEHETVDIKSRAIYGEVHEPVTDCNCLNGAKMHEVLKSVKSSLDGYGNINDLELRRKVDAALAGQKYEAKWGLGAESEYAYCSHCGHQQWASWDSYREAIENIGEFHKEYKFCPNCGFEMK